MLSAALGGNSCTALMAATSAAESELDESRTTLQFATRAMSVVNKVTKNVVVDGSALLDQYRSEIEKLKATVVQKDGVIVQQATELSEYKNDANGATRKSPLSPLAPTNGNGKKPCTGSPAN